MPEKKSGASKISESTYVIPFGRYVGTKEVRERADEVLVGREGHRAYFVDLLIGTGRKGAFLVTGRRGAGKTSFVSHCIAEYEASVLKRFLRHDIGHAYWDRVLVLLFWALLLIGGLLLAEVLYLLVPLTGRGPRLSLLWLFLVPVAIALLFPCVYARAVFEVVLENPPWRRKGQGTFALERNKLADTRLSSVMATILVLIAAVALWFCAGLASPAWSASAMLTVLGALYLGGQALSLQGSEMRKGADPWFVRLRKWRSVVASCGFVGLLLFLIWRTLEVSGNHLQSMPPGLDLDERRAIAIGAVLINSGVASFLLGSGLLLRFVYQEVAAVHSLARYQREVHGGYLKTALRRGAKNYFGPALFFMGLAGVLAWWGCAGERVPFALLELCKLAFGITGLVVAFSVLIQLDYHSDAEGIELPACRFEPPSRSCLAAGAIISIVLALQLAQPVVSHVLEPVVSRVSLPSGVGTIWERILSPGHAPPSLSALDPLRSSPLRFVTRDGQLFNQRDMAQERPWLKGDVVFGSRFEALLWLVLAVGLLAFLHFIQYEWVVRPHVAAREGDPPDSESGAPWEDADTLQLQDVEPDLNRWRTHRKMAELTLPWAVAKIWLPSVAVSVNLGLDAKLGSGPVIQAMLVGLRDAYYRIFTSWTAGPANIGRLGVLIGLLALMTLAGDTWFKLPTPESVEGWARMALERDEEGQLHLAGSSACTILFATREVRAVILPDLVVRSESLLT